MQYISLLGDGILGLDTFFEKIIEYVFMAIYYVFIGIAKILDYVQLLFRKLAGIDSYVYNGEIVEGDIVLSLIQSDVVKNVFWSLVILGVVLLFISVFVAVLKTEWNWEKEGNSKKKVIANTFRAIANMVLVPVVCIFGIIMGNAVLSSLDKATAPQQATTISASIWITASYNCNRVRDTSSTFYKVYFAEGMNAEGYNKFGIFTDDSSGIGVKKSAADKIDDAFLNGTKIPTVSMGDTTISIPTLSYTGQGKSSGFAYDDNSLAWGFEVKSGETNFNILNYNLVRVYYNASQFDYIIGIGGAIFMAYIMLTVVFGLIKRLFTILIYFCIVPPIIAVSPLDEGAAFKNWKKTFLSAVISAYSAVVVMNLYLVFMAALGGLKLFYTNAAILNWAMTPLNYMAKLFILIGGGLFVKDAIAAISSMIGGDDLMKAGDGKAAAAAGVVGRGIAFGAGVAGGVAGGAKAIAGFGKNIKEYGLSGAMAMAKAERKDKIEADKNNEKTFRGKLNKAFNNPKKSLTQAIGGKFFKDSKEGLYEGMGQKDKPPVPGGGGGDGTPNAPRGKMSNAERMQAVLKSDAYLKASNDVQEDMRKYALKPKTNKSDETKYNAYNSAIESNENVMKGLIPEPTDEEFQKAQDYLSKVKYTASGAPDKRFTHISENQKIVDARNGTLTLSAADKATYDAAKTARDAAQKNMIKLKQTTKTGVTKIAEEIDKKAKDNAYKQAVQEEAKKQKDINKILKP